MSNETKSEAAIVIVADYHGWQILYDPESSKWFARQGRKHIRTEAYGKYRESQFGMQEAIRDRNVTDARKEARKDAPTLTFRLWEKELETEETLLGYSSQGLRFESGLRRNNHGDEIRVIPDDCDAKPLHRAVEALRAAKLAMESALAFCTVEVEFKHEFSWSANEYFAEEDRARGEIKAAKER